MQRNGAEIVTADGEINVFLRCLVAIMENRLGKSILVIPVEEIEALRGTRMVTLRPSQNRRNIIVETMSPEQAEAKARAHRIVMPEGVEGVALRPGS